jgi:hypothetical protein
MNFPNIQGCIVCEDVREEVFRKSTILGFYGLAPGVQILMKDIGLPIGRLVFFFVAEPTGQGDFHVALRIVDDEEKEVVKVPAPVTFEPGRSNIVWNMQGLVFPKAGKYTITLLASGEEKYRTWIEIRRGQEKDFKV